MKIHQPVLIETEDKIVISSEFETNDGKNILWYEFDNKYKDFIVTEQSDAFVVGLLLLALKLNENIILGN